MSDTIYALSSGNPPAAIAVVRVSGPRAGTALQIIAGKRPVARHATLAWLRDPETDEAIDNALVFYFPGPHSETGEDLAEFHVHGGRAVVAALQAALSKIEGLRLAKPGEFTRRAFDNGKIDLTGVEAIADLVTAETEGQRRAALALAGGMLSRRIEDWQHKLLGLSARIEAMLDMADEAEVGEGLPSDWHAALKALVGEIGAALASPHAERLRDGVRTVIAGPPNSGKSSLLNLLVGREAAITSPVEGTTRDIVEAPVAIRGIPILLTDTAGLRESDDAIEAIGVARARQRIAGADLLIWLGDPADCPGVVPAIRAQAKCDLMPQDVRNQAAEIHFSSVTSEGIDALVATLLERAAALLPKENEVALNSRHREALAACFESLDDASAAEDPILIAEELRRARLELDRITGRAGVEDMLDTLFGSLCIGK